MWGGTDEATEATLTLDELYSLYRYTYSAHEIELDRWLEGCSGLPLLARAVAEFAGSDAEEGKPMRSVAEFRLALAHGAGALGPLGWMPT